MLPRKIIRIHPILLDIKIYNSIAYAAKELNIDHRHIIRVCKKELMSCGGYYWRYYDEYFNELCNGSQFIKCYPQSNEVFNNKFICNPFYLTGNMNGYINPCFTLLPGEILKDIPFYEGLYQASNYGRIVSIRNYPYIKDKKFCLDRYGYCTVSLCDNNNNQKTYTVHRLIAQTFIPNPNNLPCINHKNEIKIDNKPENLEWCTHEYNTNYGTAISRRVKTRYSNQTLK